MRRLIGCPLLCLTIASCAGGRSWVRGTAGDARSTQNAHWIFDDPKTAESRATPAPPAAPRSGDPLSNEELADAPGPRPLLSISGSSQGAKGLARAVLLGMFRNTYYDFPAEAEYSGPKIAVMSASCRKIADVPRPFFEALCVQGSGTLESGATVSFAKRDCGCAEVCPRTGQKVCFESLDPREFPWGRGATGKPVTPLRSVAVDTEVIPLGTTLYIAEFDGAPRAPDGAPHDGCFVAEDRGVKVIGEHVDIFTGDPRITAHLNQLIPSNRGVHVYAGAERCR